MSDKIKISVIIPVYNAEEYLRETLDSILGQTLHELEVICLDNASNDSSLSILKEYENKDSRVFVWANESNLNAGPARNQGIEFASGEYVHFLDADDYLVSDDVYENLYTIAKKNDAEVVRCQSYGLDIQTNERSTRYYGLSYVPDDKFEKCLKYNTKDDFFLKMAVVPWIGIFSLEFLKKHPKLRFNNLKCVNDRSFFVLFLLLAERLVLSKVFAVLHRMNNPNSLVGKRLENYDCHFKSYDIIKDYTKSLSYEDKRTLLRYEMDDMFSWFFKGETKEYYQSIRDGLFTFLFNLDKTFWGNQYTITQYERSYRYEVGVQDNSTPNSNAEASFPAMDAKVISYNDNDYCFPKPDRNGNNEFDKFVYANSFGYCEQRSNIGLEKTACDSNIFISFNEKDFITRHDCSEFVCNKRFNYSVWKPVDGICIETYIIFGAPVHYRVHFIHTLMDFNFYDAGFALNTDSFHTEFCMRKTVSLRNREQISEAICLEGYAKPMCFKTISGANTIYPNCTIPALLRHFKPGSYCFVSAFIGDIARPDAAIHAKEFLQEVSVENGVVALAGEYYSPKYDYSYVVNARDVEVATLKDKIFQRDEWLDIRAKKIDELETKIKKLLEIQTVMKEKHKADTDQLQGRLVSIKEGYDKKADEANQLKNRLVAIKEGYDKKVGETNQLKNRLVAIKEGYDKKVGETNNLKTKLGKLEENFDKKIIENERLKTQLLDAKKSYSEKNQEANKLKERISEKTEETRKLLEKLIDLQDAYALQIKETTSILKTIDEKEEACI